MSKTIKELATELGIDKQRLYRYIKKNHISDVHQTKSVIYIDDVLEIELIKEFNKEITSSDVHQKHIESVSNDVEVIQLLKEQLEKSHHRNEHLQKLLENQQVLTLKAQERVQLLETQKEEKETEIIEQPPKKKWRFWK